MCYVNAAEKRKEMANMFKGPALAYFVRQVRCAKTFDDAVVMLRKRYTNLEKKYRLLVEWQGRCLTISMPDDPISSDIGIFRALSL